MAFRDEKWDLVHWRKDKGVDAGEICEEKLSLMERHIANKVVLDLGCGVGQEASRFASTAGKVYGIDAGKVEISKARERSTEKGIENTCFMVATIEQLPFRDSVFDVIYSCWVIEHVERPERMIAEINRVLKPGGRLLLWVPNIGNITCFITRIMPVSVKVKLLRLLLKRQEVSHLKCYYRANSVRKLDHLCKGRLERTFLRWYDSPPYFFTSRLLCYLWYARHKLSSIPLLGWLRTDFYAEYTKL